MRQQTTDYRLAMALAERDTAREESASLRAQMAIAQAEIAKLKRRLFEQRLLDTAIIEADEQERRA